MKHGQPVFTGTHVPSGSSTDLNVKRYFRAKRLFYRHRLSMALGLAGMALCYTPVYAQSTTADVVGTVTDKSGAVVPNAAVELTNLDTREKRTDVTDSSGQYSFTLLKPNHYSLKVAASGFKANSINSFSLAAGDRAREDSHLDIGSADEVVSVDAAPPSLHTDTSALTTTITEKATQELPLNGRNYINLVQLTAGATEGLNNGLASGNRPDDRRLTSSVSVNGQSDVINNQLIDGMDNNERVIGSIGVRPSVDAIQEVNIQTNVFTAEVGRSAGAMINVITKSGTNQFHGTVYEFFRNDVLNAQPFKFGANIPKPKWRQNQFGGSLGGPIFKDRTFFFADYEGFNLVRGLNPVQTTVPTAFERANVGDFTDNFTTDANGVKKYTLVNPTVTSIDPIGRQYLNLFPLPTTTGFANNYTVSPRNSQFSKTADGRIDHRFSNGDLFYLRYTYNGVNTNIGGLFPAVGTAAGTIFPGGNLSSYPGPATSRAHQGQLNYVHVFTPNLLIELKGGYTLLNNAQYPLNYGQNINAQFGQPNINVSGRTAELSAVTINQGSNLGARPPIIYLENTFQYEGMLNWTHGKQSIKFGAGLIRRQDTITQTDTANGSWTFTDFSTLLAGDYLNATRNAILYQPRNRTWEPHAFLQDDYRLTSTFTVNLGIRYDLFTPYTEVSNLMSNFDTDLGRIVVAGQNGIDNHANIRTDYRNVAPRLGFAYTPISRTVVRGGFGMSYAPENMTSGAALVNQPFTAAYGPFTPGTADAAFKKFANGLPTSVPTNAITPTGSVSAALDPHFKSSYIEQFNLTVEREFAGNVASVSYVGELGRRLAYYLSDYNAATPNFQTYADPNNPLVPASAPFYTTAASPALSSFNYNTLRRFYAQQPGITSIPYLTTNAISSYHALQAVLKRRYSKGLDLQVTYTLAHGLDDAETISNNGGNGFGSVASQISTLEYGNANLDVRQRVTGTFNYTLPFGNNLRGVAGVLAKGWQANGLIVWNTGMPFSVTNITNRSGTRPGVATSDRPNMVASPRVSHPTIGAWFNTSTFQFQQVGTVGNERRNQLYGPGLQRVDLSLFKNFQLMEKLNLELRTEAFNVLNTAQFAYPTAILGNAANGTISSTANAYNPRLIQFAARFKF
ncbi:TonB-dependent receptor [Terriglobus saanensis]|uniref:TonB-dependent receptor n=1 Tax=Terriglobus saanensis (strain ATCC BAA-1853 / DSM 23119 / SP1PR4) TaxID=401053 RepID=E8V355_TERSS|nr:carboxypeptidase regulatory-like domain-containing protein [Terriglobus saanensis]ADV81330.1 TonB-dependent receptor [Terriglobus saanensis SP1PR4]